MPTWECPICGGVMRSVITYDYGCPLIKYKCKCGYDSSSDAVHYSNESVITKSSVSNAINK